RRTAGPPPPPPERSAADGPQYQHHRLYSGLQRPFLFQSRLSAALRCHALRNTRRAARPGALAAFEPATPIARRICGRGRPVACTEPGMRAGVIFLFVSSAMLLATAAEAFDAYDSKGLFADPMFRPTPPARSSKGSYDPHDVRNCIGVEWDEKHSLALAKVTASPRVNFVKSPYDDEFKAATCPAATDACRKKSFLIPGDL